MNEEGVPVESDWGSHCYVCNKPIEPYVREEILGIGNRLVGIRYRQPEDDDEDAQGNSDYGQCEICNDFFHEECDDGWHDDSCVHMCTPCYHNGIERGEIEVEDEDI